MDAISRESLEDRKGRALQICMHWVGGNPGRSLTWVAAVQGGPLGACRARARQEAEGNPPGAVVRAHPTCPIMVSVEGHLRSHWQHICDKACMHPSTAVTRALHACI